MPGNLCLIGRITTCFFYDEAELSETQLKCPAASRRLVQLAEEERTSKPANEAEPMSLQVLRRLAFITLLATVFAGCNQRQNPQDLREKTAEATADAKRDAKAVAEGIREGWTRDRPLNLNTATKEQLMALPDVSSGEADRIIEGRPYAAPDDLVTKHVLSKAEYDKIADRVVAKK